MYLSLGVAEDDSLGDCEGVVEVTQGVKLPLLSLHRHEELLDSFQRQLVTVDIQQSVRQASDVTNLLRTTKVHVQVIKKKKK